MEELLTAQSQVKTASAITTQPNRLLQQEKDCRKQTSAITIRITNN